MVNASGTVRHMWELRQDDALFREIRTHVYHATSLLNYRVIREDGFLRPNDGRFPDSTGQSRISRARKLGAISFFDFVSPSFADVFDDDTYHHWTYMLGALASHGCAMLIGFLPCDLTDKWITHVKAKELVPEFNIMLPTVEACYQGAIPVKYIRKQIVYDRLDISHFHIFDGRLLDDQEVSALEEEHKCSRPLEMPEWLSPTS